MERVQVVTIGNEVLNGLVVNTNAAYLCRQLVELGLGVSAIHTIPDDLPSLKKGLQRALEESNLVICTGGLGPTCDDNTKDVAADLMGSALHFNEQLAQELRDRFGAGLASLQNQSTVPDKAICLANPHGTAPGFLFETDRVTLILLPGVPIELHLMFEQSVKPYLEGRLQHKKKKKTYYTLLPNTDENDVDPLLREVERRFPDLEIGIYARAGMITTAFSFFPEQEVDAKAVVQEISDRFSDRAIPSKNGRIEEDVMQLFIENRWTLCLAESCTGGAIAARLTALGGSSAYFLGSVVSYANTLKEKLLHVRPETLQVHGAVSEETALEMAIGAVRLSTSDFGLAVTGIAGPSGGSADRPVGTVWIAAANKAGRARAIRYTVRGDRARIIDVSVNKALCQLWHFCRGGPH